jgi:threonine dehydratase
LLNPSSAASSRGSASQLSAASGTSRFSLAELAEASALVRRSIAPTPVYRWPLLDKLVGTEVWVKHENHTPTGAFKVRGGLVYVDQLRRERPHIAGIVSATRGNHGQSLAFAGVAAGLAVVIVVPHGNSPDKNAAMSGFGAEVIEHGHDFQASREYSVQLAAERGYEAVPSYHPALVLGVATYAHELFESVAELDTVYVAVGMGSGISGLIQVRDLLGLRTEVVGVVAEQAPATALSFAAGGVVATDSANTFVDGVACRVPDAAAISVILGGAARIVQVSESAAAAAMRTLYATTHNVAEPAGALALAGLLAERDATAGRRVAVIHSGGNLDADLLTLVLTGGTPVAR